MHIHRARFTGLLTLVVLLLASLACNLPSRNSLNPTGQDQLTNEALNSPGNNPSDQNITPGGERLTITLTEGQLNAIVQQAVQTDPNQTIENLQIHLQPGEVALSGIVNQDNLSLPLRLTLSISPDGQGGLTYQVSSASIGPLPLPQAMRDQIEGRLNETLQEPVRQLSDNVYIEEITIGDGVLNLTGHTR